MSSLYSLSRKEGWRRWVDTPARQRPEALTKRQLAKLGTEAREDYNEARHDWHATRGPARPHPTVLVSLESLARCLGRANPPSMD